MNAMSPMKIKPLPSADSDTDGAEQTRRNIAQAKAGGFIERDNRSARAVEAATQLARARRVGRDIGVKDGVDFGPMGRPGTVVMEWRDPADMNRQTKNPKTIRGSRRVDILVTMMKRGSPIDLWHVAGANSWRLDYEIGIEGAHPGRDPDAPARDPHGPASDPEAARLDALGRFRRAMQAVGQSLSAVLVHVVLVGQDVTTFAKWKGIKQEHAMGYLVAALDRLVEFYEISTEIKAGEVDPLAP